MNNTKLEDKFFKAIFTISDLGIYGAIPGIRKFIMDEHMRVYHIYSRIANSGITDDMNKDFKKLYPTYFDDNKGKDFWELEVYLKFAAERYNRRICDKLNAENASMILDFYVSDDLMFTGMLKVDHSKQVYFEMKEVEL